MARRAASVGSLVATGGVWKCVNGSETPQKTRPIPIPALNSMANQEIKPYSGRSESLPSRIEPKRENMRKMAINKKALIPRRYNHPKPFETKFWAMPVTFPRFAAPMSDSGKIPHMVKSTQKMTETIKTFVILLFRVFSIVFNTFFRILHVVL